MAVVSATEVVGTAEALVVQMAAMVVLVVVGLVVAKEVGVKEVVAKEP